MRLLKQLCIGVEFVFCQRSAQCFPYFPLPTLSGLPIWEANLADNVVGVCNYASILR